MIIYVKNLIDKNCKQIENLSKTQLAISFLKVIFMLCWRFLKGFIKIIPFIILGTIIGRDNVTGITMGSYDVIFSSSALNVLNYFKDIINDYIQYTFDVPSIVEPVKEPIVEEYTGDSIIVSLPISPDPTEPPRTTIMSNIYGYMEIMQSIKNLSKYSLGQATIYFPYLLGFSSLIYISYSGYSYYNHLREMLTASYWLRATSTSLFSIGTGFLSYFNIWGSSAINAGVNLTGQIIVRSYWDTLKDWFYGTTATTEIDDTVVVGREFITTTDGGRADRVGGPAVLVTNHGDSPANMSSGGTPDSVTGGSYDPNITFTVDSTYIPNEPQVQWNPPEAIDLSNPNS